MSYKSFNQNDSNLGQSGAEILIKITNDVISVNKNVAKNLKLYDKLSAQYKKHQEMENESRFFKLPRLISEFNNNGFYMEYINGASLGMYHYYSNFNQSQNVNDKLNKILHHILLDSKKIDKVALQSARELLNLKIASLQANTPRSIINILLPYFESLHEYFSRSTFLIGYNHGDLSFENILVKSHSEIYVIDPIPSPINSPLIDLGRLSLDAKYGWWNSSLNETIHSRSSNLELNERIEQLVKVHDIPLLDLVAFRLLSAFRIMPYTKNLTRKGKLMQAIHKDGIYLAKEMGNCR